jgi:hypothetical protein
MAPLAEQAVARSFEEVVTLKAARQETLPGIDEACGPASFVVSNR